jgi:hypothetical protein
VPAADTAETAAASGRTIAGRRMDKRLAKRHKRQVSRSRQKIKLSEPDLRTPEQVEAARLASRPDLRRDKNPWPSLRSDSGTPEPSDPSQ